MRAIEKRDGFKGQILYVIPRRLLASVAQHILVSGLYPTDIGHYPRASHHYLERAEGAEQNILIICTRGQGWFEINGVKKILRPNEALLIPRKQPHRYGASPDDPWTIQWVHFEGEDAPYYLTLVHGAFTMQLHRTLTPRIDRLFHDAYEALANGFSQQSIICAAHVVRHIMGLLFFDNKAFSPNTKTGRSHNLDNVIQFMKEHLDANLTIDEMARQAGLSPAHFSRLFTQQVAFPPMKYFIHLKIQRACRFLTLTQLSIKEISSNLGFTDQYYFSRTFHKVMGTSPVSYRRIQTG
jgi:AraC family transcriptional regulator, arabinose operon regulatory protein